MKKMNGLFVAVCASSLMFACGSNNQQADTQNTDTAAVSQLADSTQASVAQSAETDTDTAAATGTAAAAGQDQKADAPGQPGDHRQPEGAPQNAREADPGQKDSRTGLQKAWDGTKKVAGEVGEGTADGAKAVGHGVKKGAQAVGHVASDGAKAVKDAVKGKDQ